MGEVVSARKKEKADLIYVYGLTDMDELRQIPEVYDILDDCKKDQIKQDDINGFEFTNKMISNTDTISLKDEIYSIKEEEKEIDCFGDIDWDDI